jgi:hypothetical protein
MAMQTMKEIGQEVINERSQSARAYYRRAVRPIYGATIKGIPEHIGSAILLRLDEAHFLLTAAHVLDHNQNTSLYLGGDDLILLQFESISTASPGGNRDNDHVDFAIANLDNAIVSKLTEAMFITKDDISSYVGSAEGRIYSCLGYPNSKNKSNPYKGTKVIPMLGLYTSVGRSSSKLQAIANDQFHILIDHDAKYSCDESGKRVSSIALPGFSGGAIIDLGRVSPDNIASPPSPKLAALLIEAHAKEKVILGTKLATILSALSTHQSTKPASASTENPPL